MYCSREKCLEPVLEGHETWKIDPAIEMIFPEKSRKTGIMGMTTIRSLSGKGGKIPEGGFNLVPSSKKTRTNSLTYV